MRILHLLAQRPGCTGSGVFLQQMIREAQRKGHQQGMVAACNRGDPCPPAPDWTRYVEFQTPGLPFAVCGMSDEMPYRSTPYGSLSSGELARWEEAFGAALQEARREFVPEAVLSHHLWFLSARARTVFPEVPLVVFCHGTDLRQIRRHPGLAQGLVDPLRRSDAIVALHPRQRREILDWLGIPPGRVVVGGVGYDASVFHPPRIPPGPPEDRPARILYAGKIARAKGLLPLFESLRMLAVERPLEVTLAGSGTEPAVVSAAPPFVRMPGHLEPPELADAMRRHDLLVLPSYYEGLPLVVLEALGSGLPVVATDLPGLGEWLGEELQKKGALRLVAPPGMAAVDRPCAADLPRFAEDLASAIRASLARRPDPGWIAGVARRRSWQAVFAVAEEAILRAWPAGTPR